MLRNEQVTIAIPRNGVYEQDWQFRARSVDGRTWEPIDLTGHTLAMRFKRVAGQGSVIANATFNIYDPANGWFTVRINGSDFSSVQGSTDIVTLAYDLKSIASDGTAFVYPSGHALLMPGVS
jgi:hypothetical protein